MTLSGSVKSFLVAKFWKPIVDESVFYNPFNTAVYSGLFAVAAAYIGFPTLKKLDVDLDRDFFVGIAPFIFFGGAMRSLKDIEVFNTILIETPFIYILMFGIVVGSIILSQRLATKTELEYHKILFTTGSLLLLLTLPFYSLNNTLGFLMIAGVTLLWIAVLYGALKLVAPDLLSYSFFLPVGAHFMDASVTSVALFFPGTAEKHVLARHFIEIFGPFKGMFLMKSLVIIPAVYYIIKEVEGEEKRYYLFLIALLGFAIATRNFLSFVTLT